MTTAHQSMHLSFCSLGGVPLDFQARTREMGRKLRRGARQGKFPLTGTPVFWLPKNATEALNAVKASIVAIQNGQYVEGMFDDIDSMHRKE